MVPQKLSFAKHRYEPCFTKIKNFDVMQRPAKLGRSSRQPSKKPMAVSKGTGPSVNLGPTIPTASYNGKHPSSFLLGKHSATKQ